jgi:DNA modification methylase
MTVTIHIGDVFDQLAQLPDDSVDCCVTSPPYWGLRDYAVDGQIGLEPTLGEHLDVMVRVFDEVRRVLKPTGVCWINYGDCYATKPNGRSAAYTKTEGGDDRTFRDKPFSTVGPIYDAGYRQRTTGGIHAERRPDAGGRVVAGGYLKAKDLCMVPQRLFIALQESGWWVRSVLPWVKRNGMPESIADRPANSIEYVAMLTKSARYWYDADAVRRMASPNSHARKPGPNSRVNVDRVPTPRKIAKAGSGIRSNEEFDAVLLGDMLADRNFRNVDLFFDSIAAPWGLISDGEGTPIAIDVTPQAFKEAHFATFPPMLIEPLIKAGCPQGGVVLDPFGGAGTTGLVADRLQRDAILIELNPDYAEIANARVSGPRGGLLDVMEHAA